MVSTCQPLTADEAWSGLDRLHCEIASLNRPESSGGKEKCLGCVVLLPSVKRELDSAEAAVDLEAARPNIAEAKTLLDRLIDMTTAAAEGEHT